MSLPNRWDIKSLNSLWYFNLDQTSNEKPADYKKYIDPDESAAEAGEAEVIEDDTENSYSPKAIDVRPIGGRVAYYLEHRLSTAGTLTHSQISSTPTTSVSIGGASSSGSRKRQKIIPVGKPAASIQFGTPGSRWATTILKLPSCS